jgi:hypothetical protein
MIITSTMDRSGRSFPYMEEFVGNLEADSVLHLEMNM